MPEAHALDVETLGIVVAQCFPHLELLFCLHLAIAMPPVFAELIRKNGLKPVGKPWECGQGIYLAEKAESAKSFCRNEGCLLEVKVRIRS